MHTGIENDDQGVAERTAIVTEISIGRHPGPLPSDGEVCIAV